MATLSYTITITPNDYDSTVTIVLKIGDRFLESNSFQFFISSMIHPSLIYIINPFSCI